jgi:hypothetical protein
MSRRTAKMGRHVQALFDMNRRQTEGVVSAEQASRLLVQRLLEYLRVQIDSGDDARRSLHLTRKSA